MQPVFSYQWEVYFRFENKPVSGISYEEALTYAEWKGKRLPKEYELKFVNNDTLKEIF